jgi:hypothetical protein
MGHIFKVLVVLMMIAVPAIAQKDATPIYDAEAHTLVATVLCKARIPSAPPMQYTPNGWPLIRPQPPVTVTCMVHSIARPPQQPARLACWVLALPVLCQFGDSLFYSPWVKTEKPTNVCVTFPKVGTTQETTAVLERPHDYCFHQLEQNERYIFPVYKARLRYELPD